MANFNTRVRVVVSSSARSEEIPNKNTETTRWGNTSDDLVIARNGYQSRETGDECEWLLALFASDTVTSNCDRSALAVAIQYSDVTGAA